MIIFHSVVKTPLETFRRRVDFPYCTGLFLLIFALSWQITLCELQNMRCFYQPLPWKSLTGIYNYNLCFVFPFQNFPRSLKNFVTRNNVVVDQRSFDNRWTKKICFVVARNAWLILCLAVQGACFFEDWSRVLKGTMKIPSPEWSSKVLLLYRQILKQGKSLKYTDYDFFRRTIRREFEQQRDEVKIKVIKEQYEVLSTNFVTVLLFYCFEPYTIFLCSSWLTLI